MARGCGGEKYGGGGYSRLVVVDDGSRDATYEILQGCAKEKPFLIPLTKENGGHGSAVIFGYAYALENGADYIFQTDADGQTDPLEFAAFWEEREEYEAIFGERRKRGDGRLRAFVEKTLCFLLYLYFGVWLPDANAPFRLMRASYLREFLPKLPSREYNLPNAALTVFGAYFKKKIKFLPISFKPRQGGKNSINMGRIAGIGARALGDFGRLRRQIRKEARHGE